MVKGALSILINADVAQYPTILKVEVGWKVPMCSQEIARRWIASGMIVSLLFGVAPGAFAGGSVKHGKVLANQWCSNCHIIESKMPNAIESQPMGPDFVTMKNINAANLKARLGKPHPVMSSFPNPSDRQVADLAAYMASVSGN
jgi:mono/diheme cytochrome c family protein